MYISKFQSQNQQNESYFSNNFPREKLSDSSWVDENIHGANLLGERYATRNESAIGHWSGTGAGKTLSAVLASRVINAHLTVICCPNSVVDGWEKAILDIFPGSVVAKKTFSLFPFPLNLKCICLASIAVRFELIPMGSQPPLNLMPLRVLYSSYVLVLRADRPYPLELNARGFFSRILLNPIKAQNR